MNIIFLVKLGKSGSKIREILVQIFGDNAMKKTVAYKWVTHFSEGRESGPYEESSGRPATSRTEKKRKFRQIIRENLQLTITSIAEKANI
jgi:transposase